VIGHAEIRERLELAAVDPGGLDRLAAGDTPEAAAIAGHLAGCPSCTEEARRLATIGPILREVAETIPPDALRERTLALVREVGRPRGMDADLARTTSVPSAAPATRPRRTFGWPAAIAAVLAIVLVGGGLLGVRLTQQLREQSEALAELNSATFRLTAEPDATLVGLSGKDSGPGAIAGTLLFSPTTTELVVSAPGLAEPSAGRELACWVTRADGTRARMGKMEFGAGLAYWTGWAEELKAAGPGTVFGVTMVDASGKPVGSGDLLTGTVQGG
jgi:hypothetical protein